MDSIESNKHILSDYEKKESTYSGLVNMLQELLGNILRERGIIVHSISGRAKGRSSLAGKLHKHGTYEHLTDLTDLAGLRIITYLAEDVDRVAQVIEEEFAIDQDNSVDKRRSLEFDRFGYLSLHHVVSLSDVRCSLTEYRAYTGLKAEVQIRSILQHAWAEIEHDLGYKSAIEVPQPIRRRFARVASLLELVDDEFNGIKRDLINYRETIAVEVQRHEAEVQLNLDSLIAFVESSPIVQRLDKLIADSSKRDLKPSALAVSNTIQKLQNLELKTIASVSDALQSNEAGTLKFAEYWLGSHGGMHLPQGISVYYCWLFLVSDKDEAEIYRLLEKETDDNYPLGAKERSDISTASSAKKTGVLVREDLASS